MTESQPVPEQPPRLSFGVPVRNGSASIERCLDSILAQDFADFEVIVSDNASTDDTRTIVERYAARDSRITLVSQPENLGLIENFNHVARRARGEFFRWVGADDWLEPDYASECIRALEEAPNAVLATSFFDLEKPDGEIVYAEHRGTFVDQDTPSKRLRKLLWFFHAGAELYEPNYSLIRREVLIRTGLLKIHRKTDWLMSSQLSLMGPFAHVPKRLFHRSFPYVEDPQLDRRLHPVSNADLRPSTPRLLAGLLAMIAQSEISLPERLAASLLVLRFCARETLRVGKVRANRFRRERLHLTKDRLRLPRT